VSKLPAHAGVKRIIPRFEIASTMREAALHKMIFSPEEVEWVAWRNTGQMRHLSPILEKVGWTGAADLPVWHVQFFFFFFHPPRPAAAPNNFPDRRAAARRHLGAEFINTVREIRPVPAGETLGRAI